MATASTVKVSPSPMILVGVKLAKLGARIQWSSVPVTSRVSVLTSAYRWLAACQFSWPRITSPDCGNSWTKSGWRSSASVARSPGIARMYRSTTSRVDNVFMKALLRMRDFQLIVVGHRGTRAGARHRGILVSHW